MTSCRNFRRSSRLPENGVGGFNFFFVSDETGSLGVDPAIAFVVMGSSGSVSVKSGSSSLNSGEP